MPTDGIIFLHADHLPRCRVRLDKYFDGYRVLQLMSSGSIDLYYDDTHHHLSGAWYWPNFPGPRIRFHPAPPTVSWEHRFVAVTGKAVDRWWNEGFFPRAPQPALAGYEDVRRFDTLLRTINDHSKWSRRRAANILESILLDLAEERAGRYSVNDDWMNNVLARMDTRLSQGIDYQELAAELGMAPVSLRRRFKHTVGVSIHSYFIQRKIEAAKKLLSGTDRPHKDIAAELGYSDEYYFSRQFSNITGVSPREYRKSRISTAGKQP